MLWGILIGFVLCIVLEVGIVAYLRWQLQRMEKPVPDYIAPGKLSTAWTNWRTKRKEYKDKKRLAKAKPKPVGEWDGRYVVFKSNGETLPPETNFFLMQYDKEGNEPERQALALYADLIAATDKEMSANIKKKLRRVKTTLEEGDE